MKLRHGRKMMCSVTSALDGYTVGTVRLKGNGDSWVDTRRCADFYTQFLHPSLRTHKVEGSKLKEEVVEGESIALVQSLVQLLRG